MRYSKMIIAIIIILNIQFTIAVLVVFVKTGSEPVALVGAFFAFTGTELWNLAQIKKHKLKGKENKNDQENCN